MVLMLRSGLLEVGGGYGVWRWMKGSASLLVGLVGLLGLGLYGIVAALEPLPFGRAFAAYGGVFVLISLVFSGVFDNFRPDRWDLAGAALVGAGVLVMLYGGSR
jgi:small multidrug resistance family-3 protein